MIEIHTVENSIEVTLGGSGVRIEKRTFRLLLDNSVAGRYKDYEKALETNRISHGSLTELARKGEIPYPLFFAPFDFVEQQVETKTEKLLQGLGRETFSVGSRMKVELRDVELIVKDLIRKQQLLRKTDKTLTQNKIIGLLAKNGRSVEEDAVKLMTEIELSANDWQRCKTNSTALELFIQKLEAKQILVSRSVQNFMPQRLNHVKFSGMTIRDNKVPYIFLAGGDHNDYQEPYGRTIFTLALMTVLVAKKMFVPMTWDGGNFEAEQGREYDVAGAMLMPAVDLKSFKLNSIKDTKEASRVFNVTPSALTVRAMRLGHLKKEDAFALLEELKDEFGLRDKNKPRKAILPANAVRKYNGREFTQRMLTALDSGRISQAEFCRSVCLNRIRPAQIGDLRRALQ